MKPQIFIIMKFPRWALNYTHLAVTIDFALKKNENYYSYVF